MSEYRIPAVAMKAGRVQVGRAVLAALADQGLDSSNSAALAHGAMVGAIGADEALTMGRDIATQPEALAVPAGLDGAGLATRLLGRDDPRSVEFAERLLRTAESHQLHPLAAAVAVLAEARSRSLERAAPSRGMER